MARLRFHLRNWNQPSESTVDGSKLRCTVIRGLGSQFECRAGRNSSAEEIFFSSDSHLNGGIVGSQSTPPRRVEAYRYQLPVIILVPLLALVIQAYLPLYVASVEIVNLPLLVVVYFALTRHSPLLGLLTGALIGVAQDSLSRDPIGLFATANSVTGYVTSLLSSWVDAERLGIRVLTVFIAYSLYLVCFHILNSVWLGNALEPAIGKSLVTVLVNATLGVLLYSLLDRFRIPA